MIFYILFQCAMFTHEEIFKEASARVIHFPGVNKITFYQVLDRDQMTLLPTDLTTLRPSLGHTVLFKYSRVSNKRRATFIKF